MPSKSHVELNAGGPSAKFNLNVNVMNTILVVGFIAYFLYAQHEFASLHMEIATLEAKLTECMEIVTSILVESQT